MAVQSSGIDTLSSPTGQEV